MSANYKWEWDLTVLYGDNYLMGFHEELRILEIEIEQYKGKLVNLPVPQTYNDLPQFLSLLKLTNQLDSRIDQTQSFAHCLRNYDRLPNLDAMLALQLQLQTQFTKAMLQFDAWISAIPAPILDSFMKHNDAQEVAESLFTRIKLSKKNTTTEQEAVMADLSIDGLYAWSDFYFKLRNELKIEIGYDGNTKEYHLTQFFGKLHSANSTDRKILFSAYEQAIAEKAEWFVRILNHFSGFRITLDRYRGYDSSLEASLIQNRLQRETLDTMWNTIDKYSEEFLPFFHMQAKILGGVQLDYSDLFSSPFRLNQCISPEAAIDLMIQTFSSIIPDMAALAEKAFKNGWVDLVDRSTKGPGGSCAPLAEIKESRICLTWQNNLGSLFSLAHELGHAFHFQILYEVPALARHFSFALAETASTFAEVMMADTALHLFTDPKERFSILGSKLQRATQMLFSVRQGYEFEKDFYESRQNRMFTVDECNDMMEHAQQIAYRKALASTFKHHWAMVPHFFAPDLPFYNYQYTFGYLFSVGLIATAIENPKTFEKKYKALLRDTGRLSVEQIAEKHLGIDITQPDFWESALQLLVKDVNEFIALSY